MISKFKKGNMIVDSLFYVVILFVFVIVIFVGKIVSSEVNADIQSNDDLSVEGKAVSQNIDEKYNSLFDGVIMMALVLFWVLTLAFSFLIDSSPIFFIVSFVLLVAVLIVAAYLGNAYEELVSDDAFDGVADGFPMTHFVFSNLLGFVVAISLSIGVSLYAKTRT